MRKTKLTIHQQLYKVKCIQTNKQLLKCKQDHNSLRIVSILQRKNSQNLFDKSFSFWYDGRTTSRLFPIRSLVILCNFFWLLLISAILFKINVSKPPKQRKTITYRKYRDIDISYLTDDLRNISNPETNQESVEQLVKTYNSQLESVIDKHTWISFFITKIWILKKRCFKQD
jgi:hypothetical protein